MTRLAVEIPQSYGPKWLGGLRIVLSDDGDLVLTALSARGTEKYEWVIPADSIQKTLDTVGLSR